MEWEKEGFKQKYTPRTEAPRQDKPKVTTHHDQKQSTGAQPLSAVRVMSIIIIAMILLLIFFYFRNGSLATSVDELEEQNKKLDETLNKTIASYEEKVNILDSEKTAVQNDLDQEKKVRDVAQREATLQQINSQDLGIKMQSATSDKQITQQQLDLEKQRNADLSNIISQMTNTTTTMQATIKELNDKLNACVLSGS